MAPNDNFVTRDAVVAPLGKKIKGKKQKGRFTWRKLTLPTPQSESTGSPSEQTPNSSQPDSEATGSKSEHLPSRVPFIRGLSNTTDGFELTKDDICRVLLKISHSDSDRLDAVILSALLNNKSCELFSGAPETTVPSLPAGTRKFLHPGGDLFTALSAVRTLLREERSGSAVNLAKWCYENGINVNVMKQILHYIKDFRALWDYEDEHLDQSEKSWGRTMMNDLIHTFHDDLCYFLGHHSLGYQKIKTGEIVPICPSSVLWCYTDLPRFLIAIPRHFHTNQELMNCSYFIPVSDELASSLLHSSFPDNKAEEFKNNSVSLVPNLNNAGIHCRKYLADKWNYKSDDQSTTLHNEITKICNNTDVVLDVEQTKETGNLSVYTSPQYHSQVADYINSHLITIQEKMSSAKAELTYPESSLCRLVVVSGAKCQQVLFPFEPSPEDPTLQPLDAMRAVHTNYVKFQTDVRVTIEVGDLQPLEPDQDVFFDPELKCRAVIKRLFSCLNEKEWSFLGLNPTGSGCFTVDVIFHKHVTAKRSLMLINEATSLGIPLKVTNDKYVQQQLRAFNILVDHHIMNVLGKVLLLKLDNFNRSGKYLMEYKLTKQKNCDSLLQVVMQDVICVEHMMDRLSEFLKPLNVPAYTVQARKFFKTHVIRGKKNLLMIGEITDTFITFSSREGMIHIYGTAKNKQEGLAFVKRLRFWRNGNQNCNWQWLGSINLQNGKLPNDFYINLARHYEQSEQNPNVHVDLYRNEVWIDGDATSKNTTTLKEYATKCLQEDYDNHDEIEVINDRETPEDDECISCYTPCKDGYILESCGHTYCHECLRTQISVAVKETKLPLTCACCDTPISVLDLETWSSDLKICDLRKILETSARDFIPEHHDEFRACVRVNCVGICKFHPIQNIISCGVCFNKVCPSCLHRCHKGMSCEEYAASYLSIEQWMKENSRQRKACGNCHMAIEKYDGCNNVFCVYCKKNICWVCLKVFDDPTLCYTHMDFTGHWNDN